MLCNINISCCILNLEFNRVSMLACPIINYAKEEGSEIDFLVSPSVICLLAGIYNNYKMDL